MKDYRTAALKYLRESGRMTSEDLAAALGIPQQKAVTTIMVLLRDGEIKITGRVPAVGRQCTLKLYMLASSPVPEAIDGHANRIYGRADAPPPLPTLAELGAQLMADLPRYYRELENGRV